MATEEQKKLIMILRSRLARLAKDESDFGAETQHFEVEEYGEWETLSKWKKVENWKIFFTKRFFLGLFSLFFHVPRQTFSLIAVKRLRKWKKAHYVIKIDLILLVSLVGAHLTRQNILLSAPFSFSAEKNSRENSIYSQKKTFLLNRQFVIGLKWLPNKIEREENHIEQRKREMKIQCLPFDFHPWIGIQRDFCVLRDEILFFYSIRFHFSASSLSPSTFPTSICTRQRTTHL